MELFEYIKKALLAGFGVQDKVKELIDELVEKGELSESQGAKLVKEWSTKAEKSTVDVNKSLSELLAKSLDKMKIPTKDEIEKLSKTIHSLSARIKKLEEKLESKT